jgi:hypothetical protein
MTILPNRQGQSGPCTPSLSDAAPGLSDAAPGLSDAAPGLSDAAPGLSDAAPGIPASRTPSASDAHAICCHRSVASKRGLMLPPGPIGRNSAYADGGDE